MTSPQSRLPQLLISGVIVAVLLCQLAAIVLRVPKRAWPFVDYPMYSVRHQAGDVIHRLTLTVRLSDGRSLALDAGGAVLRDWRFRNQYFEAIRCLSAKDPGRAACADRQTYRNRLAELGGRCEQIHGAPIGRYSIVDEPVRVHREGAERLPPREVAGIDAVDLRPSHDG